MAKRPDSAPTRQDAEAADLAGEGIDATGPLVQHDPSELAAISAEIEQIRNSVSQIAEATSHYLRRRVAEHSTDIIVRNPVRAALFAVGIGFLLGRLSR